MLANYIQTHQAGILAEQHVVPETFSGVRFLAAASRVPEDFFWRAPGVAPEAQHKFSLNMFRGGTVMDPVTHQSRSFDFPAASNLPRSRVH